MATKWTWPIVCVAGFVLGSSALFAEEAAKTTEPAATSAPAALPDSYSGTNPKDEKGKDIVKWPDPTGANAGTVATPSGIAKEDGSPGGDDPSKLTMLDLSERIVHNLFSINMVWTLIAGFLVMFMQAGFAMVETGLCRAKNAAHTISMNFMIYPLGCIAFFAYGFAIGWGNWFNAPVAPGWVSTLGPGTSILNGGVGIGPNMKEEDKVDKDGKPVLDKEGKPIKEEKPDGTYRWGLMGTKGFFLNGLDDVSVMALFFFMMVFMDTTATIPTGAMAERWGWKNFCLYGLWVALPYCLFANWVWGGGWLAQMGLNWKLGHGAVDFAGSGVVHAMGGFIGLAGALVIGPRIGKFVNGKPQAMPGHHLPMVVVGTFILAFGWFGFNPGSTLSGTDLRISFVVVNTMLAGVAGALATMFYLQLRGMKPDPSMMCNGMLAGLVAITAPCAFVDPWAAVAIGLIAGVLVVESVFFWERMGIDDPVGAISVHGMNGLWGLLAVGIFANGKYGGGWNKVDGPVGGLLVGDYGQFFAQLIDMGVVAGFGFAMGFIWFKLSDKITPIRVSAEVETQGLDVPEMGALGYPDFTLATGHGMFPVPPTTGAPSSPSRQKELVTAGT